MNKINNERNNLNDLDLPPPWFHISWNKKANIEEELKCELGNNHILFGLQFDAVAMRKDADDVLLYLPSCKKPLAVVHLTWISRSEEDPNVPFTVFYDSIKDWLERGIKQL